MHPSILRGLLVVAALGAAIGCEPEDPAPECLTHLDDCADGYVCVDSECVGPTRIYQPCGDSPEMCEAEGLVCTSHVTSVDDYLKCQTPCSTNSDCPGPFDAETWTSCLTCSGRAPYCTSPSISCETY